VLQASSYWRRGEPLEIDIAPDCNVAAEIREGKIRDVGAARSVLQGFLPKRFATRWLELNEPPDWTNPALEDFERRVHKWRLTPANTEGYEKAEVTAGGVDTDELSSKTMESRSVPGLFFIGEVVDVTGHLGGHNFQWAWASGAAAGRSL
jgi:hypothetical protein